MDTTVNPTETMRALLVGKEKIKIGLYFFSKNRIGL